MSKNQIIRYKVLLLLLIIFINENEAIQLKKPKGYRLSDQIPILVGNLESTNSFLKYDYYDLPFSSPRDIHSYHTNIGQTLSGNTVFSSVYNVSMLRDSSSILSCENFINHENLYNKEDISKFIKFIKDGYRAKLQIDDLWGYQFVDGNIYNGYKIGESISDTKAKLNNHLTFVISLKKVQEKKIEDESIFNVVGFKIIPSSVKYTDSHELYTNHGPLYISSDQSDEDSTFILFTYSVVYNFNPYISWSERWDYISINSILTKGYSIIWAYLTFMYLFMTFWIYHKHIKFIANAQNLNDLSNHELFYSHIPQSLRKYISKSSNLQFYAINLQNIKSEVFRTPKHPVILSSLVGSGSQITVAILLSLIVGAIIPPATNNESIITYLLGCYLFTGVVSGYVSKRVYQSMGGMKEGIKFDISLSLITSLFIPTILFILYMVFFTSLATVPLFLILLYGIIIWVFGHTLMVYFGIYIANQQEKPEIPIQPKNDIPPSIPSVSSFRIVNFFIFLAFILMMYYFTFFEIDSKTLELTIIRDIYSFLSFQYFLQIVIVSQLSVIRTVMMFFQGDYDWWWSSFPCNLSPLILTLLVTIGTLPFKLEGGIVFYLFVTTYRFFIIFLSNSAITYLSSYFIARVIYSKRLLRDKYFEIPKSLEEQQQLLLINFDIITNNNAGDIIKKL